MLKVMPWVMALVSLIGTLLNIQKIRWGFGFWMISNLYWQMHNVYLEEYAQAVLYGVFFVLSVVGFLSWKDISSD